MKQEPIERESTIVLASRIAKYSYGTPSPDTKSNIKSRNAVEPSPTRVVRLTSRRVTPLTSTGPQERVVRSPHLTRSPLRSSRTVQPKTHHEREVRAVSSCTLESDDDLESLDGNENEAGASSQMTTRCTAVCQGEGSEDDGLEAFVESSDSDDDGEEAEEEGEEETDNSPSTSRLQTRIRTRRAGRHDLNLADETKEPTSRPSRKRRTVQDDQTTPRTKKGKKPRAYANPETYKHLKPLPDILASGLAVVFCGINPGVKSSTTGHHFGHPTNKFWRSLHLSGMTSRLFSSAEDHLLPTEYSYGLTVLVDRPTAEQSELSTQEMRLNALPFTDKLLRIKPKIVCFVGKKIWDVYESVIRKSARPIDHARNSPVVKSEVQAFETAAIPVPGVTTTSTCDVKQEAPDQVESKPIIRNTVPSTPQSQSRGNRTPTRPKVRFDWTKPRPFRLPHGDDDSQVLSYTYFWVVPNTSGLERTPLAEQTVLFGHLNKFKEEVIAGRVGNNFQDIDPIGVKETVEALRLAAEAKERGNAA